MDKILSVADSTPNCLPWHVELVLSILGKSVGADSKALAEKSFIFLCAVIFFECGFALDYEDVVSCCSSTDTTVSALTSETSVRAHNLLRKTVPTFDLRSIVMSCIGYRAKILSCLKYDAPDFPLALPPSDHGFRLVVVPAAGACILNFLVSLRKEDQRSAISPTLIFSITVHPLKFLASPIDCHHLITSPRLQTSKEDFRNLQELSLRIKDSIINPATNEALSSDPVINTRSITGLPYEVLLHIASFLDVCAIMRLAGTCKQFLSFGHDTFLWKMLLRRDLGVNLECSMDYEDLVEEYKMRIRPPLLRSCSSQFFRSIEDFRPRRFLAASRRSSESESFNSIAPYVIALHQASSPTFSVSNVYSNILSRQ